MSEVKDVDFDTENVEGDMDELENMPERENLVDPKAVEAEMIAEAKRKAEDPAEQAAMVFTTYRTGYERAVKKLKGKAHTRLLNALVMAPLVSVELITEAEKEAYYYADSMIQAKWIMSMQVFKDSAQEIIDGVEVETIYENVEKTGE